MEKPPAAPKPGTAGGSKNSSLTLDISRPFSSSSCNDLLRGHLAFGPGLQIDETGPRVRAAALGQNLVTGQRGDRVDSFDLLAIACSSWALELVYSSVEPGGVWMIP